MKYLLAIVLVLIAVYLSVRPHQEVGIAPSKSEPEAAPSEEAVTTSDPGQAEPSKSVPARPQPENLQTKKSTGGPPSNLEQVPETRQAIDDCLAVSPTSTRCLASRVALELRSGTLSAQEDAVAKCLTAAPDNVVCLGGQAELLLNSGHQKAAIDIYQKILANSQSQSTPDSGRPTVEKSDVELRLGNALEKSGDLQQAMNFYYHSCNLGNAKACAQFQLLSQ